MNKITVEPVRSRDDLDGIVDLLADEKLVQTVGLMLPRQRENRVLAIKVFIQQNHIVVVKLNKKVIGMIMLSNWYGDEGKRLLHHYELGYLLQRNQWNKGIMTFALRKVILSLPSKIIIHAECKKSNFRSQRVLIKCGFTYEQDDLWQYIVK